MKKRTSHVREAYPFLEYLRGISPRRQRLIIKGADLPILHALSEICLNLIKKNIDLTPSQISKLKPFEEEIYQLTLRKNSLAKKKRIVQKGGAFLSTLLTLLPSLLGTVLATSK